MDRTRGAHLVGSVPLEDTEQVLRAAASALGAHLRRVPDGETGARLDWILWQLPVLLDHPQLELAEASSDEYSPNPRVRVRDAERGGLRFERLGYADAVNASWAVFDDLQRSGAIPGTWRFQVSLPTPLAPVAVFVVPEDQAAVETAYSDAMRREVDEIVNAIPAERLAIQWDCAVEFGLLEGIAPAHFSPVDDGIRSRVVEYGRWVPDQVDLGYHLCYGDLNHRHFVEPEDAGFLTCLANAVSHGLTRRLDWVHLPVPRSRDDAAYFAPLTDLELDGQTELYLGLVHHTDGREGTLRRIRAAQSVVTNFGVATECGLGRRAPDTIRTVLQVHASVSAPWT